MDIISQTKLRYLGLIQSFLLAIILVSCASSGGNVEDLSAENSQSRIESSQEVSELNSKIFKEGAAPPISPGDYIIGPSDLLDIKVFESDKLSSTVRVSSRGFVTLPLVGNVEVSGLSTRESEQKIEQLLKAEGYIRDPHVSVFIQEHKSKVISVMGNVKEPGNYELLGAQTLLDALANAKGLTDSAGNTIYITRVGNQGERKSIMVDIDEILRRGADPEYNVYVRPGDVIFVPESGNIFVEGAVLKPGSYPIKGDATVSQVISQAGGVASFADKGDVTLIRYEGNGERNIVELNLAEIREGAQEDPMVQDRDAIIVGSSGLKRLLYGFRISLGYGLVGVGYDPPDK